MPLRPIAILVCLIAASASSVALAASVKAGGTYSSQGTLEFAEVAKNGKTAKLTVNPGSCGGGLPMTAVKSATIRGKTIKYTGLAKTVIGTSGMISLTGTFTNAKTLKWVAKITLGACHSTGKTTLTLSLH